MTKDLQLEIPSSTIVGTVIAAIGSFGVYLGTRFLNNNDDIRKKVTEHDAKLREIVLNQNRNIEAVAKLQENQIMMQASFAQVISKQESQERKIGSLVYDISDRNGYLHTRMHEIIGQLNTKQLKDGIVDDIYEKMKNIETFLKKNEKNN